MSESYREIVLEQLERFQCVTWRKIFGGFGVYSGDAFFALTKIHRVFFLMLLAWAGCTTQSKHPTSLERIRCSGQGFITETSRRPFHPWGMNYGNLGRLMEDFWDSDWATLEEDFFELKALGANVVRVHLQVGKFMNGPQEPNWKQFHQLQRLLHLAEASGLYLDITGLACYRPSDIPAWYHALDESGRWAAQAQFWETVSKVCAGHSAVFCYDLMNEPISPAQPRREGQWMSGNLFGDLDFVQYIALNPSGRRREEIAVAWIRELKKAIRKWDQNTLITVGLLPWSRDWKHLSGFLPTAVAPELDFISVHLYPDSRKPGEALESLKQFAVGSPIVIEETFPLSCGVAELEEFLRASRGIAQGWMGHYDGQTPVELDALEREGKLQIGPAIYRDWLRLFVRIGPEFR